jgi:hypothetical protein
MANKKINKSSANEEWKYIPLDDPSLVWTTYDFNCSVALLYVGFELLGIDKSKDPRKALFVFKKEDGIENVANLYLSDSLEGKLRTFADTIKALKNRLYSE